MATHFEDKKGNYYIKYLDKDDKWCNKYLGSSKKITKTELKEILRKFNSMEHSKNYDIKLKKSAKTVDNLLSDYKAWCMLRNGGKPLAKETIRNYDNNIAKISEWFKLKNVKIMEKLTETNIFSFVSDMMGIFELSENTTILPQRMFIRFLKWCVNNGYFHNAKVIPQIKRLRTKETRPRFFSEKELNIIFENANERDTLIFQFLYSTGLRISELCNLRWFDYNEFNNELEIDGKGDRIDTIPLNALAVSILKKQRGKHKEYVFVNSWGKQCNRSSLFCNLTRIAKSHDIQNCSLHTFRHTFASQLIKANVNLLIIKELMRHANIRETMIYAKVDEKDIKRGTENLPLIESLSA